MASPHQFADQAMGAALRDRTNLRDLVAAVAPDVAPTLDFARSVFIETRLKLPDFRRRQSDVMCEVPFIERRRDPALVNVLVEHQSSPDNEMPLRVILYSVLYWLRVRQEQRDGAQPRGLLPAVVPIVFHSGPRAWRRHRTLEELIYRNEPTRNLCPRWSILFWNLAERSIDALLDSASVWFQSLAVVRAEKFDRDGWARSRAR